jgi:glycosyltransferase involved in cell wall biosynthesis/uncharacterized membrane protein
VRVDGKFFSCGAERFPFRGVTYGTFRTRGDGVLLPDAETIAGDMAAISRAGFTVVRTYTPPSEDMLECAGEAGLRVLGSAFFEDWRYMLGASRRERARMARQARQTVRRVARALAGNPVLAALSIGNEIPGDVVRWVGAEVVARTLGELVEVVREEDPELPVTYGNYPTTEYLSVPGLDFLMFNVFLEREQDFRSYLARLHNLAGERPVVLGEIGLDAGRGEALQAETLEWQLAAALERGVAGTCVFSWTDEWWVDDRRVEGWRFGLTNADRRPRPALEVAARSNRRTLADLNPQWPSVSVVVCARNAQRTLDECLESVCALDYPELEVVVVDDGSTDATAAAARRHPGVRLIQIPPSGLSNARNAGAQAARGEIVAFLDSDAFVPHEWPYLLALGFDRPTVGGVGGPNLPPADDPLAAHAVAQAPGGPVHVLLSDDRAEHIPGCNMAFWRELIERLGGFDPIFTAAGDDVDFCWRALDAGWDLAFHPAAFVWHRRRASVRGYVRQQRGYGRAEALVQARHPERFTPAGTARWRGSIYGSLVQRVFRGRIYRGEFGSAAFQSVYRGTGHGLELAHQVGAPAAVLALLSAPAAITGWEWALPALAGLIWLAALAILDATAIRLPVGVRAPGRIRALAIALHLLQPLPRLWGRLPASVPLRRDRRAPVALPGPAQRQPGGVLVLPLAGPRTELARLIVSCLGASGVRIASGGPWEDFDATLYASSLVTGKLLTSAHPEGSVQVRIDSRPRFGRLAVLGGAIAVLASLAPVAAAVLAGAGVLELARGLWRARSARDFIRRAARARG